MATVSRTVKYITQWMRLFCEERDIQQENSYTKHAFRKRILVTATLGRVNEAYSEMLCGLCWVSGIRFSAKHFSRRKCFKLLSVKIEEVSKNHRVPINCYSWRACVHYWVKWPERESDNEKLYNFEITYGAIILNPYRTVRRI